MNEEGLRGAKAMRNMVAGQVAVKLPRACTAPMGAWNKTSEVSRIHTACLPLNCAASFVQLTLWMIAVQCFTALRSITLCLSDLNLFCNSRLFATADIR